MGAPHYSAFRVIHQIIDHNSNEKYMKAYQEFYGLSKQKLFSHFHIHLAWKSRLTQMLQFHTPVTEKLSL